MNTFGRIFKVSIYGESHGKSIGVVIDGCPPGIPLQEEDFLEDLSKRKSGIKGTTSRKEKDEIELESGVFQGFTTGSPIHIYFRNIDIKSKDYDEIKHTARPGHADYVAYKKYKGFHDFRGGGHFSGRLTLALVAAGVVAKKMIPNIHIRAEIKEVYGQKTLENVIEEAINEGDSVGAIVECTTQNIPVGLGEPFFDSLESCISHIMFAIPAVKGIEFGAGFESAKMRGSEHNDEITIDGKTLTNHAGGVNGGISNGNDLVFRIAVKPASSIAKEQFSINMQTNEPKKIKVEGRHDACIGLRVPVVVEAACAIVLADFTLINQSFSAINSSE